MSVFTNPATEAAEHAAAYISAVLELLGDRDPTAVLREMPLALPRSIEGLSPQQLRQSERPGKWSIGQILQHLADSEVVWAWRMRLILAQDRPQPEDCGDRELLALMYGASLLHPGCAAAGAHFVPRHERFQSRVQKSTPPLGQHRGLRRG